MTEIATDRLRLRSFRVDDSEPLYAMIQQYEASGLAVYDHEWPPTKEEYPKIVQWFAGGDSYWAVCLQEDGRFIGFVCLNPEQKEARREYNLGYSFDFGYHGKGYATEACTAVLRYAFEQLGADAVVTGTAERNETSCRLLTRLGFRVTRRSTGSFRSTPEGKPIEFTGCEYKITLEEWKQAR